MSILAAVLMLLTLVVVNGAGSINAGSVTITVLVLLAGYIVACIAWPWTSCARCDGTAKLRSPTGKAWRDCTRCAGTGRKVRLGRRLWSGFGDLRDRGQR